jgi:hypothetical protein
VPATRESAWPPTGIFSDGQTRTHASAMVGPVMVLAAAGADTAAPWKPERRAGVKPAVRRAGNVQRCARGQSQHPQESPWRHPANTHHAGS